MLFCLPPGRSVVDQEFVEMRKSRNILVVFHAGITQFLALIILLCGAGYREIQHPSVLADNDIWTHLSVGNWIIKNHAVPYTGVFSQSADKPWSAYSWIFEVLVSWIHSAGGLLGLMLFLIILEVLVTWAIFHTLHRISESFWAAWGLTAAGLWAIYADLPIRPVVFSVLFFTIALHLIYSARRQASMRPLYWLLPLFVLWANIHIQFIYGLVVVGLFVSAQLMQAFFERMEWPWPEADQEMNLPAVPLAVVGLGCILATLINPYGIGLYGDIAGYAQSKNVYAQISELAALDFRSIAHFVLLLITAASCFALGRESKDPFKIALVMLATLVGYRSARDSWFACIPALIIIASALECASDDRVSSRMRANWLRFLGVAFGVILALYAALSNSTVNERSLQYSLTAITPVRAVEFIKKEKPPGPLYNGLNIGGFLMWYLPEYPVAMDGRTNLYGDEMVNRFYNVLMLNTDPAKDKDLEQANTVLMQKGFPLTMYLLKDRRFKLVYQDHNSCVFVKNQ
jgi:hypothetical protein